MTLHPNMNIRPVTRSTGSRLEPVTPPSLATHANVAAIERHTSVLGRWRADSVANRQASYSLAEIKTLCIQTNERIACTALKIAEAQIKTALVSGSIMQIGALTMDLNNKTAAVEQQLTTGGHGEFISHLENRAASVASIMELERSGRISTQEATVLTSFAEADAVEDINRSRERTLKAKQAVEMLHAFALEGIARAKESVG
jgi:hypothetical protein